MLTTSAESSFLFRDDGFSSTLDRFLAVFVTERISLSSLRNEIENLTKALSVKLSSYTCTCHPKLTILSTNPSTPKMDAKTDPLRADLALGSLRFRITSFPRPSLDLLDVDFLPVEAVIRVAGNVALSIADKRDAPQIIFDEERIGTQGQVFILILREL